MQIFIHFPGKTSALIAHCKKLEKSAKAARQAVLRDMAREIAVSPVSTNGGLTRIERTVDGLQSDELRVLALDTLSAVGDGVVILTTRSDQKYSVVACCSKSAIAAGCHAGNIVKEIASARGGSGGGRPEFAMGGYVVTA